VSLPLFRWLYYKVHDRKAPRRSPRRGRRGPWRSFKYRRFIREHCCCACGSWKFVEAAHTGDHGISSKASDADTIPLCGWCHIGKQGNLHRVGRLRFELEHGIDFGAIIRSLRQEWENIQEEGL
jgi:hypothetical protein